jgi:hypothetical membrane protein
MKSARLGATAGQLGVAIVLLAATVAAAVYRGRMGEAYSPLNHFVSELGHTHISALARLFNVGLIVSNACLIFFTLAVAWQMGGRMGQAVGTLGIITNLSGVLIGVYPMNMLAPHLLVAFIFFYSCLATIVVYSVHALLFPRSAWGRWIAVPGLISEACFLVFLGDCISLRHDLHGILHTLSHRPDVWLLPLSEWCVFLSVMVWIIVAAAHLKSEMERSTQPPENQPIVPNLAKHHN